MNPRRRVPPELRRFVELFNRERFWESHEVLEEHWRSAGSEFYHGLILYASAFVHVLRGNPHGILAQFEKAERALSPYRPAYLGLDVDVLIERCERGREVVEQHEGASGERWGELIPSHRLALRAALLRGDEPELGRDD